MAGVVEQVLVPSDALKKSTTSVDPEIGMEELKPTRLPVKLILITFLDVKSLVNESPVGVPETRIKNSLPSFWDSIRFPAEPSPRLPPGF